MISPAYVRMMAAYNEEMNRRLYAAAATLAETQRRQDCGAFWKSIHGTFSHLLWADQIWMSRLDGWDKPHLPLADSDRFFGAEFTAMTAARQHADARMKEWAARVDEAWLASDLSWFSGATGQQQSWPRSLVVVHVFNHQTHHRGQAHALLTRFGAVTGATDLPLVLA